MAFFDRLRQKLNQLVDDHLAVPDVIYEDLQQGKGALDRGDLPLAEEHLRRATTKVPDHATAWFLLGLSQLRLGKAAEACDSLERARKLRSEDFSILATLGEARRNCGQAQAAIEAYKHALLCRVDEALLDEVYGGLGEIYLDTGEVELAVRELRKAVAISQGTDLRLVGLLGLAQQRRGDLSLACTSLSKAAAAVPPERRVLLRLCEVLLELGRGTEAKLAALRLVQEAPHDAEARCALARCHLELGQAEQAHQELVRALTEEPRRFEAHQLLAQVHLASHASETALACLRTAQTLEAPSPQAGTELLRQVLRLELELDQPAVQMGEDANHLLQLEPDDATGLACLAVATLDQPERALDLVERSIAQQETYEGRIGLGLIHATKGQQDAAVADFRTAVRINPNGQRGRRLLAQAYEAISGLAEPPAELYPTLRRLHQLFLAQPQLVPLGAEVVQIKEVFDRPLLVTVMGEFNSGKSTFVNAMIGEKVAPMGVTPTTATINVLKYGQQRAGRILWRDDRQDDLQWDEIGPFLRSLGKDRARGIRLVELLYPAEELLRVNVVDTPGLNSMIDEHEQTAKEFMGQADAVVWLFSAQQAGKRTEQDALSFLRQHRLKTVGVLNKIDQLSPDQLERVTQHLEQEFSELVDAVVPVSARQALDAMVADQQQPLEQSRFPELRRFLEEQLFDRSRKIKADAALMRLDGILQRGRSHVEQTLVLADDAIEQLHQLRAQVDQEFTDKVLSEEDQRLRAALQDLFRQGAEEVLDFVRPRRWLFGEHRASPADRDFLLDSLEDGLRHMSSHSWARIAGHLSSTWKLLCDQIAPHLESEVLAALTPWLDTTTQLVQARSSLLKQQVYTRFDAFTRGLLRGGRVDHFFSHKLPHLDLKASVIQDALIGDGVDLEGELLHPLSTWYEEAATLLVLQIERLRQDVDLFRLEQDRRLLAPILHYHGQLKTWQGDGG